MRDNRQIDERQLGLNFRFWTLIMDVESLQILINRD